MEVMHPRCAGLDLSKRDAKVCVRVREGAPARADHHMVVDDR